MDIQTIADAVLKRLLVSLGIFVVVFLSICALYHVPSSDWMVAMLASMPWAVSLVFILVSVIWFITQQLRKWRHGSNSGHEVLK